MVGYDYCSTTRFIKWTTGIGKQNSLANYVCLRYSLVPIWKFRVETTSGYIQRRIVKLTEDIKVNYDNTIRDAIGSIYEVAYGDDGVNPTTTVKVGSEQEICDISSIVNKLNIKHEEKNPNVDEINSKMKKLKISKKKA